MTSRVEHVFRPLTNVFSDTQHMFNVNEACYFILNITYIGIVVEYKLSLSCHLCPHEVTVYTQNQLVDSFFESKIEYGSYLC